MMLHCFTEVTAPHQIQGFLNLTGIVVHVGIHYTCYVLYNDNWFFYNDMEPTGRWKHVGSYENMIQSTPNPLTYGTLCFYF
jgi:hypothetical protein